jgi:hypothetical protein
MRVNFQANKNDVNLLINDQIVCSFVNSKILSENTIQSGEISITFDVSQNIINFNLESKNFEILSMKFDSIKLLKSNRYYCDFGNSLIEIDCEKATLIANTNLVIGFSGFHKFSYEVKESFYTSSYKQLSASSDLVYSKEAPSFSITFYRDFQNNNFSTLFDSYKDIQILSLANANSTEQPNSAVIYVKIISSKIDTYPAVSFPLTPQQASPVYTLAVYSEYYTNKNNKRVVPVYKLYNTNEGSVYLAEFTLENSNYINLFDGTRQFFVEVTKFIYNGYLNVKTEINGGTQTTSPQSSITSSSSTLSSIPSQNCCFQFYTGSLPYYTANWSNTTYTYDIGRLLCDFSIPETTTYQSTSFATSSNTLFYNGSNFIGVNAKYDFSNFSYKNYEWISLFFVSLDDLTNATINKNLYYLEVLYYYAEINQPDKFVFCMDDANIINFGSNYGLQAFFDFNKYLRKNAASPVTLKTIEIQLQKSTNVFPNEFRLYDFKLFTIYCGGLPKKYDIAVNAFDKNSLDELEVSITNSPADNNLNSSGLTPFTRNFNNATNASFTASSGLWKNLTDGISRNYTFEYWVLNNITDNKIYQNTYTIGVNADYMLSAYFSLQSDSSSSSSSSSCVVYGTKIHTSINETINVENLKVGDYVLGLNGSNNFTKYKITKISESHSEQIYKLSFSNNTLECSESHCVFSPLDSGFKQSLELNTNKILKCIDKNHKIDTIEILPPKKVVKLELQNNGCYFANGVLSHSQDKHPDFVAFAKNQYRAMSNTYVEFLKYGDTTWIPPSGINYLKIECIGAGGFSSSTAGGDGGDYSMIEFNNIFPEFPTFASITFTIGENPYAIPTSFIATWDIGAGLNQFWVAASSGGGIGGDTGYYGSPPNLMSLANGKRHFGGKGTTLDSGTGLGGGGAAGKNGNGQSGGDSVNFNTWWGGASGGGASTQTQRLPGNPGVEYTANAGKYAGEQAGAGGGGAGLIQGLSYGGLYGGGQGSYPPSGIPTLSSYGIIIITYRIGSESSSSSSTKSSTSSSSTSGSTGSSTFSTPSSSSTSGSSTSGSSTSGSSTSGSSTSGSSTSSSPPSSSSSSSSATTSSSSSSETSVTSPSTPPSSTTSSDTGSSTTSSATSSITDSGSGSMPPPSILALKSENQVMFSASNKYQTLWKYLISSVWKKPLLFSTASLDSSNGYVFDKESNIMFKFIIDPESYTDIINFVIISEKDNFNIENQNFTTKDTISTNNKNVKIICCPKNPEIIFTLHSEEPNTIYGFFALDDSELDSFILNLQGN